MPLQHSSSGSAFKRNVATLMGEVGKSPHVASPRQALAIAYSEQRRNRARGGVAGYDAGGGVGGSDPVQSVIAALTAGSTTQGAGSALGGSPSAMATPTTTPPSTTGIATPGSTGTSNPATPHATAAGAAVSGPAPAQVAVPQSAQMLGPQITRPISNVTLGGQTLDGQTIQPPLLGGPVSSSQASIAPQQTGVAQIGGAPQAQPTVMDEPVLGRGGFPASPLMEEPMLATGGVAHRAGGGFNMAKAPNLSPSWEERGASRGMMRGPILSAVPGRTDHHFTKVPANSYIVPADVVSGRGQGNTIAGSNVLSHMFKTGPYGAGAMGISHGSGAPRPPRPGKMFSAGGEVNDEDDGKQMVPVALAGGEFIVPPSSLKAVVNPDINEAHRVMDAWVLHERKKLRETLAKLPGPAKD